MLRRLLLWATASLVTACADRREVTVEVSIRGPDSVESPVSGLPVVALPYDRDSVLAALEATGSPRPHTQALDSLYREFRGPFSAFTLATYRADKLLDTLDALRERLDSVPRGAPEYRPLYRRFALSSESLATTQKERDAAQAVLAKARTRLAESTDSLRAEVTRWENTTFRGYDSIVQGLARQTGRQPVTDTTGADGRATLQLAPGRWWLYARSWDALDPNAEWYWNVPVNGTEEVLSSRTGKLRPRY